MEVHLKKILFFQISNYKCFISIVFLIISFISNTFCSFLPFLFKWFPQSSLYALVSVVNTHFFSTSNESFIFVMAWFSFFPFFPEFASSLFNYCCLISSLISLSFLWVLSFLPHRDHVIFIWDWGEIIV